MVGPAQEILVDGTSIYPSGDNTIDVGKAGTEFKDGYFDGTLNADSLVADTADINAGTIDNTVIGGTTPAAGTFTSLVASTADINGGSVDGTVIGGASAAAGTFTNVTATGTIDFSGATISDLGAVTTVDINGGTIDGATINGTVIGGTTPAAGTFSTLSSASAEITGGSISGITDLAVADGGTGASTAAGARTNLGLAIGSDVQAWDADLDTYSANPLTAAELGELQNIGATTISAAQWGYLGSTSAFGGSLIDDADASAARTTLGVAGSAQNETISGNWNFTGTPTGYDSLRSRQVFTSGSGTYTTPTGCTAIRVRLVGGGGGSGGPFTIDAATGGGGGGGYVEHWYFSPAATYAYAVGAAGTAGDATTNGGNGGDTTFGSLTAGGGSGSGFASYLSGVETEPGGSGGTASGGDINISGQRGGWSIAAGSVNNRQPGLGGLSALGMFGAGADGETDSGGAGAAGSAGIIIVEEFY